MAENTQYILLARFLEHIAPEARADACRELVGEFIARNKAYRCYEILADPTGFWGPGPREPAYTELPDDYWRFGKISLPSSTLTFAGRNFFVEVLLDEPTSQTQELVPEPAPPVEPADSPAPEPMSISEAAAKCPESDSYGDDDGDHPKPGRPPKKDAWEMVDGLVRGKTFDGPSACARKVYGDLRKHHGREKSAGREFDLPAEGTVRNHVQNNAERLGITWKSQ